MATPRKHGVESHYRKTVRLTTSKKQRKQMGWIDVSPEVTKWIARAWLVDGKTQAEIGKATGLKTSMVGSIVNARKNAMSWASAVGDLIVEGADITAGTKIRGRAAYEKSRRTVNRGFLHGDGS